MTDQPTDDPIGETTPETARALLWRHGLPEDVIDGALALFAQELAGKIRAHRDHTRGAVQATKVMDFAADLISPEHWARTVPAVPVSSPPPDQTAEELATACATNRRLNLRAQALESELAAYRRAVAQWKISETGTYVPLRTLAVIAKVAGLDVPDRWELHYERVERAEAELRRLAAEAQQPECTASVSGEAQQPDVCDTCDTERCETCHGCRCNKGDDNTCGYPDCPATRVKHSGPDTKFCVLCLSGEHERVDEPTPEPPTHIGGVADDCPACQAQGLHTIGHPYECPGSEK